MISNIKVQSSNYLENRKTKLLTFPDDVARLITLKHCQWDALDWIAAHDGTGSIDETLWIALQLAREFYDPTTMSFERKLRESLSNAISGSLNTVVKSRMSVTCQDDTALPD